MFIFHWFTHISISFSPSEQHEELPILPWGVMSLLFTLRHAHITHFQFAGKKKKEKSKKAHWINKVSSSINISPPGLQNVWLWDKKQLLLLSTALTGSRRCGSSDLVLFLSKPRNVLLAQGMVPCSFPVKASPTTVSRHRNAIFRCTHTETYQVLGALRISFLNDFTTGISYPSLCQIKQIQWNMWVTCKLTTGTRFKGSKETHKIIQQFFSEPSLFRKKQ